MAYLVGRVFADSRLLGFFACDPADLKLLSPRFLGGYNELESFIGERELVGYKQVGCMCGTGGQGIPVRLWVPEGPDGAHCEGVVCTTCHAIKGCAQVVRKQLVPGFPGGAGHPSIARLRNRLELAVEAVRTASAYWKQVADRCGELTATDQERLALFQELNAVGVQTAQLLQEIYAQAARQLGRPNMGS